MDEQLRDDIRAFEQEWRRRLFDETQALQLALFAQQEVADLERQWNLHDA